MGIEADESTPSKPPSKKPRGKKQAEETEKCDLYGLDDILANLPDEELFQIRRF